MSAKRYEAVTLHFNRSKQNLRVTSTSSTLLDWTKERIKEYEPRIKIQDSYGTWECPMFTVISGREITLKLFGDICHLGWEPFGWYGDKLHDDKYSLRYCADGDGVWV